MKFYLESLGHQVLLSEFNDFTKDLNKNAFEACLQTIGQVDYYILLVGSRVGGFYDRANNVSITQKEYRTAYELAKSGRLKMLMFVRKDLWIVRSDRKGLREFLEEDFKKYNEIAEDQINKIARHRSTLANDAGFLFDFIDEITRKQEMKTAETGSGTLPPANWVHTFENFGDIVDAITVEFGFDKSLSEIALQVNLEYELQQNLMMMCRKQPSGELLFYHDYAFPARQHFKGDFKAVSSIPTEHIAALIHFFLFGFGAQSNLRTKFIDQALMSGHFLEYDASIDSYRSGKIHERMKQLSGQIESYKGMATIFRPEQMSLIKRYGDALGTKPLVRVPNQDVFVAFAAYACLCNIKELTVGILRALQGDTAYLDAVTLEALNPSVEMTEAAKLEMVSLDDISDFVKHQNKISH